MENIVERLMDNHRIDEMAMEQSKAIERCIDLGKKFIEHFHKVYKEKKDSEDFSHHCYEMQNWYDSVRSIKLKSNNKPISRVHLIDWFFTVGAGVDDFLHDENEADMYEELILILLSSNTDKIVDIMNSLLS